MKNPVTALTTAVVKVLNILVVNVAVATVVVVAGHYATGKLA